MSFSLLLLGLQRENKQKFLNKRRKNIAKDISCKSRVLTDLPSFSTILNVRFSFDSLAPLYLLSQVEGTGCEQSPRDRQSRAIARDITEI